MHNKVIFCSCKASEEGRDSAGGCGAGMWCWESRGDLQECCFPHILQCGFTDVCPEGGASSFVLRLASFVGFLLPWFIFNKTLHSSTEIK